MADRLRTVGGLIAAALGVGVFGLVVVLAFGFELGVWIVGGGVPAVILVGTILYVRGVVVSGGTETTEFRADRARNVAIEFREAVTAYTQRRGRYPDWETESLDTRLDGIVDDFGAAGVTVDATDGSFTVDDPTNLRAFDDLEDAVSAFVAEQDESFRAFVRDEIRRTNAALGRLDRDVIDVADPVAGSPDDVPDDGNLDAAGEVLSRTRESGRETIGTAVERIEETITQYDRSPEVIRDRLNAAETNAADSEFVAAVSALEEATGVVEREVGSEFQSAREAVEALVETIRESPIEEYVTRDRLSTFRSVAAEADEVGSAMETDRLDELESRLRKVATAMVTELSDELDSKTDRIRRADVPVGFYEAPPAVGREYHRELERADDAEEFRREWLRAVGELTQALDEAEQKAGVADSYETVADRIRAQLRSNGRVTGDDLPVRTPEQFMELYAGSNEDVRFDESVPAVSVPGGGETYTLTVAASLADHDGTEHEFEIRVTGDDDTRTVTEREYITTEAAFTLPYGEYDVRVTVDDESFGSVERTVRVTDDREVAVTVERVSLVERVCGGDESTVRDQLPAVEDTLESRFRDGPERFLTSDTELPITDEYVPCLLAVWADSAGHDALMDDGRVLVYDHAAFAERVRFAVEDRVVDSAQPVSLAVIRDSYLSVPASEELLAETIREAGLDVTVEDGEVRPR